MACQSRPCDGCQAIPCACTLADPPFTHDKRPAPARRSTYETSRWHAKQMRRHGVSLTDVQIVALCELTVAWNADRRARHLPALTPSEVLTRGLEHGRDFLLDKKG